MEGTEIISAIKKNTSFLSKFIAVAAPIAALAYGVHWYFDNIWRPDVQLVSVDYDKKIATFKILGKERVLYAGSTIGAGFGWGVRFSGEDESRIELVKNDLTFKIISINK